MVHVFVMGVWEGERRGDSIFELRAFFIFVYIQEVTSTWKENK